LQARFRQLRTFPARVEEKTRTREKKKMQNKRKKGLVDRLVVWGGGGSADDREEEPREKRKKNKGGKKLTSWLDPLPNKKRGTGGTKEGGEKNKPFYWRNRKEERVLYDL